MKGKPQPVHRDMDEDTAWKWFKRGFKAYDDNDNIAELKADFRDQFEQMADQDAKGARGGNSVTTQSGDW